MSGERQVSRWETVTWDRGSHVHVLPVEDVIAHDETPDGECACCPTTEPVHRPDGSIGWMYVHHSLDGREQTETGGDQSEGAAVSEDPVADVPRVVNPEAVGDPEQTPVVEVPEAMQSSMRRLINNNRRSLGLDPQCPCCEGDAGGTARDLCDTCRAPVIEGTYPHGCKRTTEEREACLEGHDFYAADLIAGIAICSRCGAES